MAACAIAETSLGQRPATGFVVSVLHAVSWRAALVTQALGLLFALVPWLMHLGHRPREYLLFQLTQQAAAALFVMLAALAGDEAVRRGWQVWRAFVVALLCASLAAALAQLGLDAGLRVAGPVAGLQRFLLTFFGVGIHWGTVLMVYLNRQSARRILAGVRAGELARLQAEQRLIASRLASAESEVEPQVLRQRLERQRDLYAAGSTQADCELERLITELRDSAARGLRAAEGLEATAGAPEAAVVLWRSPP
jgi:hypothetical protein